MTVQQERLSDLPLDKNVLYRKNTIMETKQAVKVYDLTTDEERLMHMMKALGNPARMQIVRYLSENPQCITGDIVDALPLAQATVSQHLKVLRDAGVICGTIEGPAMCYCLDCGNMAWFKEQVGTLL
jgi:ArsR family transcriptional regulator, arsenate/arsenite/antimonite-responsive transcriptional repressor